MFHITKKIINNGTGTSCPALTSVCELTVLAQEPKTEDCKEYFSVNTGSNCTFSVASSTKYLDPVLAECVSGMKKAECANFSISFTKTDIVDLKVLKLNIQLHSFTEGKHIWELEVQEKVDFAEKWKIFGNYLFGASKICMAGHWYNKALFFLISCGPGGVMEKGLGERVMRLLTSCSLNLAAVQLRQALYIHAIANCSRVVSIDNRNVKALYRRAQAYDGSGDSDLALKDLRLALKVEPNSGSVRKLIKELSNPNKPKASVSSNTEDSS